MLFLSKVFKEKKLENRLSGLSKAKIRNLKCPIAYLMLTNKFKKTIFFLQQMVNKVETVRKPKIPAPAKKKNPTVPFSLNSQAPQPHKKKYFISQF